MADTEPTRSKPSLRVLEPVADAEDVSPTALEPPLTDVEVVDGETTAITTAGQYGRISLIRSQETKNGDRNRRRNEISVPL